MLLWYVASATSDGGDGGCRISWFSNAVLYCVTTGELPVRMTRGRYGSFMTSHKYLPLLVVGKAGSDKVAYDTSHCPGASPKTCFDFTGRKKTGLKMPLHRARMSWNAMECSSCAHERLGTSVDDKHGPLCTKVLEYLV